MIKNCVLLLAFFVSLQVGAQNFVATYSLASVTPSSGPIDPSPVPVVKGLLFKPLQATGVSSNSSASGRFSFSNWPLGALDGSDSYSVFTGGLSGTAYYECKLYVMPGSTLTLQSVEFSMRRSTTGVRNFSVRCDKNNFSSDLAASTGTNTKVSILPVNIFFWKYDSVSTSSDQKGMLVNPGNLSKNIIDSITFRIYAWNAESTGGSFSIDNLSFSGQMVDSTLLAGNVELNKDVFSWYPNPTTHGVIYFSRPVCPVMLYDVSGLLIRIENESRIEFNVTGLPAGIYFLRMGSAIQKVVVSQEN